MTPHWEAAGLQAGPAIEHHPAAGVAIRATRATRTAVLGAELARSLAWWLLGYVGDRRGPADPDAVQAAIDEQRAELARRSAAPETTEEARAELAWAERALDVIARAAACSDEKRIR